MILVMGATGQVGSKIANQLLSEGHEVRCIARHFPNKDSLRGAELIQGDANIVSFLEDAMRGCSAAFVMIPPNISAPETRFYQNKFGEVLAECIEETGIKKIVNLSSVGADLLSGTGPILGLHDQEERLNLIHHADIVHLRPVAFMENLLSGIPSIIAMNRFFGTIPEDAPVDLIATQDIASRAAFLLSNPNFKGHTVEYLVGERPLTYREIIRVLAQTISKPTLEYVEVPDKEMRNYFIGAGMSQDMADGMIELANALGNGTIGSTYSRDNTNATSTSIETFARKTFLNAYNKAVSADQSRRTRPAPEARP